MAFRPPEGHALVFAPSEGNAGTIARRLREVGVPSLVCADTVGFEAILTGQSDRLPIISLSPPGTAVVPPWGHTTLLTQPTTARQLVEVGARAVEARSHQHLLASRSHELRVAAFQDALTGLPDRSAVYERIRELQAERRGVAGRFAALSVDLDDFKAINDTYGHLVGDEVLRQVGAHLVAAVRATDFVGRRGGDEYMILLIGPTEAQVVAETIRQLGHDLDLKLEATSEPVRAAFSVGLFDDNSPETMPDEILSHADERMYEHKRRRRSGLG